MKKILIVLCTILMLSACTKKETVVDDTSDVAATEQEQKEIIGGETVNPMKEVGTLLDLNRLVHGKLVAPATMGIENEKYFTIKSDNMTIGQYDYTINGNKASMRFCDRATVDEDISGYYVDGGNAFPSDNVVDGIEYNQSENTLLARWFNTDGQYTFVYENPDMSLEDFEVVVSELVGLTSPDQGNLK